MSQVNATSATRVPSAPLSHSISRWRRYAHAASRTAHPSLLQPLHTVYQCYINTSQYYNERMLAPQPQTLWHISVATPTNRQTANRVRGAPPLPAQHGRRGRTFHKHFLRHASSHRGYTLYMRFSLKNRRPQPTHLILTRIATHVSTACRTISSAICKCHVTKLVSHYCIRSHNYARSSFMTVFNTRDASVTDSIDRL